MNLVQFLSSLDTSNFDKASVIYFQGNKEYPLLFFSLVRHKLKQVVSTGVTSLDVSYQDKPSIISQLETRFLGNTSFYWLNNMHALTDKQRSPWLAYIHKYTGPNVVYYFVDNQVKIVA